MPFDGSEFAPVRSLTLGGLSGQRWFRSLTRICRRALGLTPNERLRPGAWQVAETSPAQLLRMARALIELESQWVQGHYSTLRGRHCAMGAMRAILRRVNSRRAGDQAVALLRGVAEARGFRSVEEMNDQSSHAIVLSSFDEAIAIAAEHSVATVGRI